MIKIKHLKEINKKIVDKKISFFNFKGYIIKGKSTNYLGYTIKGYIKGYKDIEAIKNKRITNDYFNIKKSTLPEVRNILYYSTTAHEQDWR